MLSSSGYIEAQRRIEQALERSAEVLDLSGWELTKVPPEIVQLQNLTELDLSGNRLTDLPPEIVQLQNLTVLNLSYNELTDLPPEVVQLQSLTSLALSCLNDYSVLILPPEVVQLQNLTELDLSQNELPALPLEIVQLQNLTVLDLSGTGLTALPPEIVQLQNLTVLALSGNQLPALPPEVVQLQNLTVLNLSGNQLPALLPKVVQLQNLTRLNLSGNQLPALPPEVVQLQNLTELDLSYNRLTALPSEIAQLQSLIELDLSHNRLTALPPEVVQLQNLTRLEIGQNFNFKSPPPEVCDQGLQAIFTFLRAQQTEDERQWISKLLIVGEGGVGKTSLLRALKDQPFQTQQSTTHGIEITTLPLPHPTETDVTMTLNAWDFGGQEIYHATHQFFLTNRSLFLLAFNARLGFEQGKLVYWLKTIHANAPQSPIIIVATYADERDADLPFTDLKKQFPNIVTLHKISNKTGKGVFSLKQTVIYTAADLRLMGELWPATWLKFAKGVRITETRKTTPQNFWKVMSKAGVSEEGRPVLANWLHELGDILFFQEDDDVNDLVILKPQWVTEYISKVLEAEEVIKSNGVFTRQCMEQIWQDLPIGLRDFFLRLMERFDLSYRTLENRDISLVVERLPFEQPNYQQRWDAKKQEPNCKEISMKFQLSEILPGIPTWFIARQHRFTIEQGDRRGIHWRTGVLFQDRSQKHLALVRTLRDETTNADHLHLTVRGPIPHNFFDILRDGLELTLSRYPGLKITRFLPCPDPAAADCHHEFDYANLTKRLERTPPKKTIECPNCLENISVTRLLFGIHDTTQTDVINSINQIQKSVDQGFDTQTQHLQELSALVQRDVLQQIRAIQKQIESPCPTLFALRGDGRSVYDARKLLDQCLHLQLYCEHPGCFHPVENGGLYTIENPRQWLSTVGPHIQCITGILKYVTPIVGPWVTLADADYATLIKDDLTLTKDLIKTLPDIAYPDDSQNFLDSSANATSRQQTHRVSGSALRALHEFLKAKDKEKVWGHLSRVKTPEGDILWLCEHHKKEFYPTSG